MSGCKSDAWSGMGIGWAITSTLIRGMATVGGLGYLLDRFLDTGSGFALSIVLGAASAITSCICGTAGETSDDHG